MSSRTQSNALKGRTPLRSYSDTSSTSSSDEGYGYYEMNKAGGRYGRKYATLAAASVSRRRARPRNDRFYEAQRNLWKKGDISSNDSFEKSSTGNKQTFRDINKLTAAAFSEALKKHFSGLGNRQQEEISREATDLGLKSHKINMDGSFYIDEQFSTIPGRSEAYSGGSNKKPKKLKRKQKYYHKSSESCLKHGLRLGRHGRNRRDAASSWQGTPNTVLTLTPKIEA